MRNYVSGSIAVVVAAFVLYPGLIAQTAQQPGAAKADAKSKDFDPHDFSGIWNPAVAVQPKGQVNLFDLTDHPNPQPPFSPAGQEKFKANLKFIDAGAVLDCDPYGVARNFFTPRPFENINSRDRLLQHFEFYDNWREIWTDGRSFPEDLEPDYMGYSIGKWEGDTFVVSSQGYNGKQFLTWSGYPISPSLHQTERWQRVDHDTLKIVFTFDDPTYYSRPWSATFLWKLKSDWVLDAHPCTLSALKRYEKGISNKDNLPGNGYAPDK
jgi:hypothetical protein